MSNIKIECIKQKKIVIFMCIGLPIILSILLYVDLSYRYEGYLLPHQSGTGLSHWQLVFKEQSVFYIAEIVNILSGALVYEIFICETKNNAWSIVSSTIYGKKDVIIGKLGIISLDLFVFFIIDYICVYIIGRFIGITDVFEYSMFIKSFSIQFFSSVLMSAFLIFIVFLIKRVLYIIFIAVLFFILNIGLYYADKVKLMIEFPFTYGSYGFRATFNECILIVLLCILLSCMFVVGARLIIAKNREIR